MSTLTATPRRGTETKTSEPRTRTGTSQTNGATTAKARYALMRQALEAARGKSAAQTSGGEDRLLDFLKS